MPSSTMEIGKIVMTYNVQIALEVVAQPGRLGLWLCRVVLRADKGPTWRSVAAPLPWRIGRAGARDDCIREQMGCAQGEKKAHIRTRLGHESRQSDLIAKSRGTRASVPRQCFAGWLTRGSLILQTTTSHTFQLCAPQPVYACAPRNNAIIDFSRSRIHKQHSI